MRLVLYKIGLDKEAVEWVMGCLTNISMAVIINGSTSNFFHPSRGLRQGCALSPLLFILMMDAMSLKLKVVFDGGLFLGINIGSNLKASHSLFVDDILIFGMLRRTCWYNFNVIFQVFCKAIGMLINEGDLVYITRVVRKQISVILSPCSSMEELLFRGV